MVSLSSNITYLGAAKGERLIAEAVCVKGGRSTGYYRIACQKHHLIAALPLRDPLRMIQTFGRQWRTGTAMPWEP